METVDKVYAVDHNDNAALYAAMAGNNNNEALMAAMMNNGNQWMNNPFAYMMFMGLFSQWGGGWGGRNGAVASDINSAELSAKMNALQTALSDNHNTDLLMQSIQGNHDAMHELANNLNFGFRDVSNVISNIQSTMVGIGGQIGMSTERMINSVLLGNKDLTYAIQNGFCANKLATVESNYQNQIATLNQTNTLTSQMTGIANDISNGFNVQNYMQQKQTCDIINNSTANTLRIIDTMNAHWANDTALQLQDAKFQISQYQQNQYLINALGGGTAAGRSTTTTQG